MSERIYYSKEAELRARRNGVVIAALAMLIGASTGVIVAILFAPDRGENTRSQLARQTNDILGGGRESLDTFADEAGRTVNRVRERIEDRLNHG